MHIKSLIIDGFKSYGKRVELNDFDPEFNAITGLNGTGKSNILDAICFTLGISAMNTIRAATMQDVIYKSGQAGVHTASVTIKFDNRDKSKSAPHYTNNDEIVISREVGMGSKNTYRINGVIVTAKKIMDFFSSLHMNVNNPHFIIMQGRITKVLNMKPIEILSMVEEAAGTNTYEMKKRNLELAVSRKDGKLKEMQDITNEEILPTMIKYEKEKQMNEEFNLLQTQLRNVREKLDGWNYVQLQIKLKESNDACALMNKRKKEKLDFVADLEKKIKNTEIYLKSIMEKTDQGCKKELNDIKAKVQEVDDERTSITSAIDGFKNNIIKGEEKIKEMKEQINLSKKRVDVKKKEIEDFNKMYAGLDEENKKNKIYLEELNQKERLLNSGNIYANEDNSSVEENIKKLNDELQKQQSEIDECSVKLNGAINKLSGFTINMKEAQKTYDIQMAQLQAKEKEFEKVKNEYHKVNEELGHHDSLEKSRNILFREVENLSSIIESFESENTSLFFKYNDPQPNFDRRKVVGPVCRLFKPVDFKYELALSTLAGGKLYFIVTQDDITVKNILETNKFPNRMNFIPLNKVQSSGLSPNVIKIAQQIGGADKVFPAMSLIKFDKVHLKAMQWVFGQAFICATKEIAEKVCFDSRVKKHCFTLEGDHFNPSGSLTGGANTQKLILKSIANYDNILSQFNEKKTEFAQINNRLSAMENLRSKVSQLNDRQVIVKQELDQINSELRLGQSHQVIDVNNTKQLIAELKDQLAIGKANEKQLVSKIKDLELKMENSSNIRKQQFSEVKKNKEMVIAKIESNKEDYVKNKNIHNNLELSIKQLMREVEREEIQLAELNSEKCKHEDELRVMKTKLDSVISRYEMELKILQDAEEKIAQNNNKVAEVNNSIKDMKSLTEETTIFLMQYETEIKKAEEKHIANKEHFDQLNKKLSNDQKQMASKLDYTNFDARECNKNVVDLQTRLDQLRIGVDPGKLNNFHKNFQEFKMVQKKLDIIVNDKFKIHEIIEELDVKKCEILQQAADRVNFEFGQIFSSVLPGANACLKQINPDDITAGLEIRVAFNGLWKESLDELSGGQRSLVALSLVLAMLLFNPVPLYILDEVDAALDLSHTQNIGRMLKQHFRQSQFIIVSLKDGMFSNANVLFRTKFVDGSSAVTRTTPN